jgi:hypothetical protein
MSEACAQPAKGLTVSPRDAYGWRVVERPQQHGTLTGIARSRAEAAKAVADAADHAYTTARAAKGVGASTQQITAPADDAMQLGSPYWDGR